MNEPMIFQLEKIDWVDERAEATRAPEAMIAQAERSGAGRKRLSRGQCGFFSQYTRMPAGFHVPAHSHDHDELFIVLAGSCTLTLDGGHSVELVARDSASLSAGHPYAFTTGPAGLEFMVVRRGEAGSTFR
jgi:quercetin dioxygenase-like cupin family protein